MDTPNQGRRSVLLLEDDSTLASLLRTFFEKWEWDVVSCETVAEARAKIEDESFDLLLVDYLLPDDTGLTIFEEVQRRSPLTKVMLMTGVQDMNVAAAAFRKGAADLLPKPFHLKDLEERIDALLSEKTIQLNDEELPESIGEWARPLVGESKAIRKILRLIQMISRKAPPVLITGESGTGKELVARALHECSPRSEQPFVAINCGAIPDNLLEDELFGHVRGAFTDARVARKGKLEEADGGTLFLDEIGEMKPSLQVKLLRVLEERTVQRLGSNQEIKVDFRVIAATNADLQERIKEGSFREDLFYRLNVIPIHNPPLRERRSDIPLLVNHFLRQFAVEYEENEKHLKPEAIKVLMKHDWPGNVRELRNALELAFILAAEGEVIAVEHFPMLKGEFEGDPAGQIEDLLKLPEEGIDLNQVVNEVERNLIYQSLERTGGNKGKAARLLFLKRTTLVEKLRRMNLLEEFSSR